MHKTTGHKWTFRRQGDQNQVLLRSADDFRHIDELDPKLWAALSCPTFGLECDARTLELIDTDQDGRIRIPEVVAAVQWAVARLKNPASLAEGRDVLHLADLDESSPEGARLAATARVILASLGKEAEQGPSGTPAQSQDGTPAQILGATPALDSSEKSAQFLTRADIDQAVAGAAANLFNGDGVLPPSAALDTTVNSFIEDALAVIGGVRDAGGELGINQAIAEAFIQTLNEWRDWKMEVAALDNPQAVDLAAGWPLFQELAGKLDDYFLRAELAAYAPQASAALNVDENFIAPVEHGLLSGPALAELPLARVRADEADAPLGLRRGLNPEWRERLELFAAIIAPLLANPDELNRADWRRIKDCFAPYGEALGRKPVPVMPLDTELAAGPTADLETLDEARIAQWLAPGNPSAQAELLLNAGAPESGAAHTSAALQAFLKLAGQDAATPGAAADIADLERLMLYHSHLYRLLTNFVSFADFYAPEGRAAFQAGTLYLDGRSCALCLPVQDVGKHAELAAFSGLFLVYCECRRKNAPDAVPGGSASGSFYAASGAAHVAGQTETRNIVAAITAGGSELLMDKRNGVFIDNQGRDWDATVVKITANPISLRQAVWDPYRRFARMIGEQISKFAGSRDADLTAMAGQKLDAATAAPLTPPVAAAAPAAAPAKFDIGRSVGIFAAIGLAIGAIGTALAGIMQALFSLHWWQFPLVFLGLFLLISGPSMLLAWLKLRRRALGPLLEASGWAVNGKAHINYYLGRLLTGTAELPK